MAATKTESLEKNVEALQTELEGVRNAIRRLAVSRDSMISLISSLREDVDQARVELTRLKGTQQKAERQYAGGVERY